MQPSIRTFSKENIELEIYKTFESFHQQKTISIAEYLNKLDPVWISTIKYRSIKYPFESLYKLVLYQKIKGIKQQTQLHRYLKCHKKDLKLLSLSKSPDQRTISHFINNILTSQQKTDIDYIVQQIQTISDKFGIIFDIQEIAPAKPSKKNHQRTQKIQIKNNTHNIAKLFKKRFTRFFDFNLHDNTTYQNNDFLNQLLHIANTQDFAENGSKTRRIINPHTPDADTLLYHLKKYQDLDHVKKMFMTMYEMIWETAKKANHFPKTVDVAIDYTCWHYYGKRNASMVTEMKPDRGTSYCYKFATITITEHNQRFTLLALPVGPFDTKKEILQTLLNYAKKRVRIRRLYIDRGFFDEQSIELFKRNHIKFLMPCIANERIKKILAVAPTPTVIKDYKMKNATFNIVVVEDDEGIKRCYATNIEFNENDVGLSKRVIMLYKKRWGIETSYRVKKHSFRPKTTSKNYFIRLFYFLFSTLLYNLWLLADILISIAVLGRVQRNHLLVSKYFGSLLLAIDPGG